MVGALSLEAYLLHIHFVLVYIEKQHWGYWPTFFVCVAITLPLAWLLNKVVTLLVKPLAKRQQ
jgi:peptidoglycan/LPS O-acetylase OafA/YrhL